MLVKQESWCLDTGGLYDEDLCFRSGRDLRGCSVSPNTSTFPPRIQLRHWATDSSLHTSSWATVRVWPRASPAAASSISFFPRSLMVATTGDREQSWVRHWLLFLMSGTCTFLWSCMSSHRRIETHRFTQLYSPHIHQCTVVYITLHVYPLIHPSNTFIFWVPTKYHILF